MSPTSAALVLAWIAIGVLASALVGVIVRLAAVEKATVQRANGHGAAALPSSPRFDIFLSTTCATCAAIARELAAAEVDTRALRLFFKGGAFASIESPEGVEVSEDAGAAFEAFGIETTPTVVISHAQGRQTVVVESAAQFQRLLSEFMESTTSTKESGNANQY